MLKRQVGSLEAEAGSQREKANRAISQAGSSLSHRVIGLLSAVEDLS